MATKDPALRVWDAQRKFFHQVRMLQKRTRCSNYVCNQFVKAFEEHSPPQKKGETIQSFDKKSIRAAGADYIELHGCPQCNKHVYKPDDEEINCPFINEDGSICGYSRFDEANQPYEVGTIVFLLIIVYSLVCLYAQRAFYFSLRKRLQQLLKIPGYRELLEYERSRPQPKDADIMYDTCDSDAWKSFMGRPGSPCNRIGLVACTDGFQAHGCGTLSLKPFTYANFSLPPQLRFKNEYMLLQMFLPTNVKGYGQKKYYDFAANYELNDLYYEGQCHK